MQGFSSVSTVGVLAGLKQVNTVSAVSTADNVVPPHGGVTALSRKPNAHVNMVSSVSTVAIVSAVYH